MNESDFLQNIAERLGRKHPKSDGEIIERTAVGAPDFWQEWTLDSTAKLAQFSDALAGLGGIVHHCSSSADLRVKLGQVLHSLRPQTVGTWNLTEYGDFGFTKAQLSEVLSAYRILEWGAAHVSEFASANVGITGCTGAIADTGTLVMVAQPGRGRSVSLLPSVHIAILPLSRLKTRMGELFQEPYFTADELPSHIHFISGPSRSSDIENDQSIGVHGPAAVHVLIYDDKIVS